MEAQKGSNVGACDSCGTPPVRSKICKVTEGGCVKKKKKPERKKCTGPMKRPLPECEKSDCQGFSRINEEVDPSIAYNQSSSVSVNNIFNKHNYDKVPKTITYSDEKEDYQRNKKAVNIDNAAQILNVAMPRDGHEDSQPMKLKPQFWSKFAKTTTLPMKIESEI